MCFTSNGHLFELVLVLMARYVRYFSTLYLLSIDWVKLKIDKRSPNIVFDFIPSTPFNVLGC
jgi:hypothetical protein